MSYYQEMKTINNLARQIYAANKIGEIDSFPEEIIILPTMRCNYNCITCSQDHKDASEYPDSFFTELKKIIPFAKFVHITGGEPLLYPRLKELIQMITECETRFWTVTNASLLNENWRETLIDSSLQTIKYSIDGGTAEDYKKIRVVGDFKKVLKNIADFSQLKQQRGRNDIRQEFNFVALHQNIDSLPRLVTIASNLGIDAVNVTYCVCGNESLARNSLYFHKEQSDEKMQVAMEIGKKLGVHVAVPPLFSAPQPKDSWLSNDNCDFPYRYLGIDINGNVNVCCGSSARRGNFHTDGFKKVWNDPLFADIRRRLNTDDEHELCKKCTLCKMNPNNIKSHIPNKKLAAKIAAEFGISLEEEVLKAAS